MARAQLDAGSFKSVADVNVAAQLFKVLLRELPVPLLAQIPVETLLTAADDEVRSCRAVHCLPRSR